MFVTGLPHLFGRDKIRIREHHLYDRIIISMLSMQTSTST
jgi:hypothetical protein